MNSSESDLDFRLVRFLRIGLSCDTLKGAVKRDPDSSQVSRRVAPLSHFVLTRKWAYPASFLLMQSRRREEEQPRAKEP